MVYLLSMVFVILVWGAHPAAVAAAGTTYYVRTGGSDGHSCSQAQTDSNSTAKASIQAGMNCVGGPGDTVIVHGGTYANFNSFTEIPGVSGTNLGTGAITLKAAPGETVTLRGALDAWNNGPQFWIIDGINIDGGGIQQNTLLAAANSRYQNLDVMNSKYYGIGLADNTHMLNVRSHGHGKLTASGHCENNNAPGDDAGGQCHGFYTHVSGVIIENSEAYDNDGWGVASVYLSSGSITVRNTKLYRNGGGIQYFPGPDNPLIYNNLIYDNGGPAMWLADGAFRVYNNTFSGNSSEVILNTGNLGGTIVRNNIFANNGGAIPDTTGITHSNNLCPSAGSGCSVVGAPNFASAPAGNFHLTVGSPAIDAGLTLAEVPTDFDKNLRPQGGRFDIGAYEYKGSAPLPPPGAPTNLRIAAQ